MTVENPKHRICVIGAGTRFLSGISYYTLRLANSLASINQVSVILMRQLLPTGLYPGRDRVGVRLTDVEYASNVRVFDGVDWFWLPSLPGAITFLLRQRPEIVIFQWWTGTVLHSYLILALIARLLKAKIVIEFHEVLDTGEARLRPVRAYVDFVLPLLIRLAASVVVHSEFDRVALARHYRLRSRPVALIPHGPFDHYQQTDEGLLQRTAPASACNLLYFGVIRPFKGLEDLVRAFNALPPNEIEGYWLTVVGETWEGWTLPNELIANSCYRSRITFVNRYVNDEEVAAFFAGADAVVLPYHRSSASGPLHIAMSWGLPVIVTQVGGLSEAVADYQGVILVPPENPTAICDALRQVTRLRRSRFTDPHSWENCVARYDALFAALASK